MPLFPKCRIRNPRKPNVFKGSQKNVQVPSPASFFCLQDARNAVFTGFSAILNITENHDKPLFLPLFCPFEMIQYVSPAVANCRGILLQCDQVFPGCRSADSVHFQITAAGFLILRQRIDCICPCAPVKLQLFSIFSFKSSRLQDFLQQ